MTGDVALYAQYHPRGRLLPHVAHAISALAEAGFSVHVACSCDVDAPEEAGAWFELQNTTGATVHRRRNGGLDFGAWCALLRDGCADGARRVVLTNDSVLGPLRPLSPMLDRMSDRPAWGMVASRQIRAHLQSWFVCLDAAVLARPAVRRVFAQPFEDMGRDEIVLHGEIGLSVALDAERVDWRACWPTASARGLRRVRHLLPPANPMHAQWRRMLDDVPYLKLELLRDDPARLAPPAAWHAALTQRAYPVEWARTALSARPARGIVALNWRGRLAQRLGA